MSTAQRDPGTVAWYDLTVAAAPSVAAFYRDVLGVVVDDISMGDYADYNLLPRPGADPIAGICHARGRHAGLPAVWLPYFVVRHLAPALRTCEERGGRLIAGPVSVGEGGYAVVEDPAGATCALWADTWDGNDGDWSLAAPQSEGPQATAPSEWRWGPGVDARPLVEEIVLAGLLVASGGEGGVDGAELRTIMESLNKRFRTVGAELKLEAFGRAIERLATASIEEVSDAIVQLGEDLPASGRSAIFSDLCSVADADGSVHTMEQTLLRHIAEAWGLPPAVQQ